MKKFLLALVLVLCVVTFAESQPARDAAFSSGLKTSDAVITTGFGRLEGAICQTDGTNDTTVVLYDHATGASGTELYKMKVNYYSQFGGAIFSTPIRFRNGIYMDITNGSCIIYYSK